VNLKLEMLRSVMVILIGLAILCALGVLSGCGTVVNGAVAADEANIASNQVQVGKNAMNAKTFALCMTPVFDLNNATQGYRDAVKAACVPSGSAIGTSVIIDATGTPTK
jgi:hypothetical protein